MDVDVFDGTTLEVVALEGGDTGLVPVGSNSDATQGIRLDHTVGTYLQGWNSLRGKCSLGVKYGFWTRTDVDRFNGEDSLVPPCYVYGGSPFERKPWRGGYYEYGPPSTTDGGE